MARKHNRKSEMESILSENTRLKSEIRNLKKRLGSANKRSKHYEHLVDEVVDDAVDSDPEFISRFELPCPDCKSPINFTDLGKRLLLVCNNCGYKKSKAKR